MSLEERVAALARLAGQKIVSVMLGEKLPHLIVAFESGSVFFLNGYTPLYECWTLSTVGRDQGNGWQIVSVDLVRP